MTDVVNHAAEDPVRDDPVHAEALARLAAIIESSDDAIISKSLDGIIRTWNKGAERIFGYTADEAIGQSMMLLIPPERHDEEPHILQQLRAGERVDHFETVRKTKDGRLIDVSVTISPIRDATGRVIGASKVGRDITERKRAQQEVQAAREAAESASRAKDRFLSVLSHELRTPLMPVLAAISYVEANPHLSSDELREQVGMIRRNIETEARLVDDLLDVTRIGRGKVRLHFEVTDVHAVVRSVVAVFQSDIDEKGLAVTTALRAKEHHAWGDPVRLQQVFLNLLSNAVKFTPAGGDITVRSSNVEGQIRIDVSDTGVGIPAEDFPRLFTPFEQGEQSINREFGGLGLGLSIVKSLLEMHKGTITVASLGRGRGSTFAVTLNPVAALPREQAPLSSQPGVPPTGVKAPEPGHPARRILLVEDHADTRNVMARLLASFGFVVATAGSVREALEQAGREEFDLLVSDIGLPDGSGTDVMRQLRSRQQAIKGIALSGFGQDDDLRRSAEAGFERHLTKPVNFQTLRDVILKIAR